MTKKIESLRLSAEALFNFYKLNIVAYKKNSKGPMRPWKQYQQERQRIYDLDFPWHELSGIGVVLGPVANIHAFDLDKTLGTDPALKILELMGLGPDYPWLIQSGSGEGEHIWFESDGLLDLFGGKKNITLKNTILKCAQVELRVSETIVAPGSVHRSGKRYAFINRNDFDRPMAFIDKMDVKRILEALDVSPKVPSVGREKADASESTSLVSPRPAASDKLREDILDCIDQLRKIKSGIANSYNDWRNFGFGITHEFGEAGRGLFHEFSKLSAKYDTTKCDRFFDQILQSQSTFKGKPITAKSIFFNLRKIGIKPQVDLMKELVPDEENAFYGAFQILQSRYHISRDLFTGVIFVDGEQLDDRHINNMLVYLKAKYNFRSIKKDDIVSILRSDYVHKHHRILDALKDYEPKKKSGNIEALRHTLVSQTGEGITVLWHGVQRPFLDVIIEVYMVKMIKGFFDEEVNDIVLVLLGDMHLGKTYWILNLLPSELSDLSKITQFTNSKDFLTLLTNSALLVIDEIREKDLDSNEYMKLIITTRRFPLRPVYGYEDRMRKRIASLAGTGNNMFILRDVTGNRRFVPIWLSNINRDAFNRIDKMDLLYEVYQLYQGGYDTSLDNLVPAIATISKDFEVRTEADELLLAYCPPSSPNDPTSSLLSVREMCNKLEFETMRKFNFTQIGLAVDRLGYEGKTVATRTYNGKLSKVWKYYCNADCDERPEVKDWWPRPEPNENKEPAGLSNSEMKLSAMDEVGDCSDFFDDVDW